MSYLSESYTVKLRLFRAAGNGLAIRPFQEASLVQYAQETASYLARLSSSSRIPGTINQEWVKHFCTLGFHPLSYSWA